MNLIKTSAVSAVAFLVASTFVSAETYGPPDWCPCPWCGQWEDHHAYGPPAYAQWQGHGGPGYAGPYAAPGGQASGYYLLWYVLGWTVPLLVLGGVVLVLLWLARRVLGVGRRND